MSGAGDYALQIERLHQSLADTSPKSDEPKEWVTGVEVVTSYVCTRCAELEEENAKLHWYVKDIRRILDRVPDPSLPRSVRFKQWGKQTLIEMATRTAPRVAVIWGGAAIAAYLVHLTVR